MIRTKNIIENDFNENKRKIKLLHDDMKVSMNILKKLAVSGNIDFLVLNEIRNKLNLNTHKMNELEKIQNNLIVELIRIDEIDRFEKMRLDLIINNL